MAGQHLLKKTDKKTVLHDLLGVQAQITVNAYHALKIRCHDLTEENFGAGLVKNWTLRGTVHIFAEEDLPLFKEIFAKVEQEVGKPLAVELEPLKNFYAGEEYHQDYLNKNPGGYCHIPFELMKIAREANK